MKKSVGLTTFILITLLVGIAIHKLIYPDAKNVSQSEIKIAKEDARDILEFPLDGLLVMKLVVHEKTQNKIYVNAYSFFGLKYTIVEVDVTPGLGRSITRLSPFRPFFIPTDISKSQ